MPLDVQHDRAARVFFSVVDGERCELEYALDGNTMTITHTGVPQALGGRGYAGDLTRAALNAAREQGWKVIPACSYAQQFFAKHADYADLLVA